MQQTAVLTPFTSFLRLNQHCRCHSLMKEMDKRFIHVFINFKNREKLGSGCAVP